MHNTGRERWYNNMSHKYCSSSGTAVVSSSPNTQECQLLGFNYRWDIKDEYNVTPKTTTTTLGRTDEAIKEIKKYEFDTKDTYIYIVTSSTIQIATRTRKTKLPKSPPYPECNNIIILKMEGNPNNVDQSEEMSHLTILWTQCLLCIYTRGTTPTKQKYKQ